MASDLSMTDAGSGTFPVVGIGASAGGLEALTAFLRAVEFDSMAFVIVQHRSADHESRLVELLARATRLKVSEITDGVRAEPNQVYVAPAGAHVAMLGRALHLVQSNSRLPIDFLFRSLAGELGEHSIGVVLSGTGSDGTFGLQAIKEHGGICLVQSPETAKFDAMPRSAIDRRVADAALAPEALARELASISRHPYLRPGLRPKPAGLHKLYGLLRERFGHDLSGYKENTIERRIERRMAVQKIENIE
jgi:two-component system CheB/CheR fusion protein